MTYQHGANYDRWRQLGKPKFEDIKLQVGMSMSQPFYQWLTDFMKGVPTRKTGAIVAADFYYLERARRNFKAAMIKELTFPKLDGADKSAAYMSVALSVEEIEFLKGTGKKLDTPAGFVSPTSRGGDFSVLAFGALARGSLLAIADGNGVRRFFVNVRGGAGFGPVGPKNFYESAETLVFGGLGIEYFTRLRHFSVGLDADMLYGVSHMGAGMMIAPNLRYTF
jgi:hypothetical protein